jgi:hypothetical protein
MENHLSRNRKQKSFGFVLKFEWFRKEILWSRMKFAARMKPKFSINEVNEDEQNWPNHGQTLANRTKPWPSSQAEKWLCLCYLLMFLLSKTA